VKGADEIATDDAHPLGSSGGVMETTARLLRDAGSCHKWSIGDDEVFRSVEADVDNWLIR